MKHIKIMGDDFKYVVNYECSEMDYWEWTEFYKETVSHCRRKYMGIFGPIVITEEPLILFRVGFNIEDPIRTKEELRSILNRKVELLNRGEEIKRGELI